MGEFDKKKKRKVVKISALITRDVYDKYVYYLKTEGYSVSYGTALLIENYVRDMDEELKKLKYGTL